MKILIIILSIWTITLQLRVMQLDTNQYQLKSATELLSRGLLELRGRK